MKKFASIFLTVTIILSCFCTLHVSAETTIITRSEAISWLRSIEGTSIGTPYGYYGECASLGYRYYEKLLGRGIFADGGGGRTGHGKDYDDNNHSVNLGWEKATITASTTLQEGDVIVSNYEPYGHVAIFISGTASNATLAHQANSNNFNGKVKLNSGNNLVGRTYVRPNWKGGASVPSLDKPSGISNTSRTLRWKELWQTYNDATVKELQACLNYILNAGLKVDGCYGIGTHDAVKEFQGKYGLKVDGDAGPQTLKKANEVLSGMGGGHTHSFSGTGHEEVHPHREYKKCSSCGETELTGKTVSDANCAQCTTPGKPELLNMKEQYYADSEIQFTWNPTVNTTHYNLYISKQDSSGEYKSYENVFYAESGMTRTFDVGKYKVFLQPTNSKAWTDDKSTWRYTNSDMYYFEVTERHTHAYTEKYDRNHPHNVYKACDCGDIQYLNETKKVKTCEECYPHEHEYVAKYETIHPHEKYWVCACGEIKETDETEKISGCAECYPIVEKKTLKLQIGIPNMYVDGVGTEIDPGRGTAPVIRNARTLLPIRMIMESFGAYVVWDESENKVTIYADDVTMHFWIGSRKAVVDDREYTMDVEPLIINQRTFMPIRFIAEKMGLTVGWNEVNQTVTIEGNR